MAAADSAPASPSLLAVSDLRVEVPAGGALRPAVDGVSFTIEPGECLAVVGESGCGKTMVGRALLDLLPEGARRSGSLLFRGRDLAALSDREWSGGRGSAPARSRSSFRSPRPPSTPFAPSGLRSRRLSGGPAPWTAPRSAGGRGGSSRETGFRDPERGLSEYAHRLSGGQRQRAFLAIALAGGPALLVADEPTASLDATVAADVLDLLDRLRARRRALLLITHDLSSAARRADRALVLYAGRVVEEGPAGAVLSAPSHPY